MNQGQGNGQMQKTLHAEHTGTPLMVKQRPGWQLVVVRTVYMVLTGSAVFLFVFSFPTYFAQLQIVCPGLPSCSFFGQLSRGTLTWLQQAHISVSTYAASFLALVSLNALLALIFGIAIVWRLWGKENEVMGLLTSFVLILGGTIATKSGSFATFSPAIPLVLDIVGTLSFLLYWPAFAMFLLTFPTGRFAPRWTWLLLFLWLIQIVLFGILQNGPLLLLAAELLLVYGSSYAVLYWRYRHFYTHIQRQQTKWLLYGFVPFSLLNILSLALGSIPALNTPDSLYLIGEPIIEVLSFLIVPVAIGIALLRYQLWDIDLLIKRTLVYGSLSVSLGLIYVSLIIALQMLLQGIIGRGNELVIVASTLAIAALFDPLRRLIQAFIDRRFYRRKYDAARTLAAFSTTLRNEVDLTQLREQLVSVVQETMQPSHVSLWLREPDSKLPRPDRMAPRQLSQ